MNVILSVILSIAVRIYDTLVTLRRNEVNVWISEILNFLYFWMTIFQLCHYDQNAQFKVDWN